LIDDSLQFGLMSLLAGPQLRHTTSQFVEGEEAFLISRQQTLHALVATSEIAPERLFSAFGGVGFARNSQATVELLLNETGIFEQTQDFFPDYGIQQILPDRMSVTDRPGQPAPSVRTQASVIVDRACARSRGCAVKAITTVGAADQALHNAWSDSTSW
jgi:hypothetical protein